MTKSATVLLVCAVAAGAAHAQSPVMAPAAGRFTVSAEVLSMWFKSSPTPAPILTDDYYGLPTTSVLLGGGSIDTGGNFGFQLTGRYAVDANMGIELSGFYVPSRSTSRGVSSSGQDGSTDLLLPYIDVRYGHEDIAAISYSPDWAGSARETLDNSLGGGQLNLTWSLAPQGAWNLDVIGGFRYLQLKETYTVNTTSPYIPPNPADVWATTDQFAATNRFYGLQLGLRATTAQGPWTGSGSLKVAVGTMRQQVAVSGFLETNDFNDYGATQIFPGGYYALPTNSGTHGQNEFAVVPELGLSIGYHVTPSLTIYAGYTFLYASNVVRPAEQLNRNVNPTYTTAYSEASPAKPSGTPPPAVSFTTSDFWAQSIALGVAYRF